MVKIKYEDALFKLRGELSKKVDTLSRRYKIQQSIIFMDFYVLLSGFNEKISQDIDKDHQENIRDKLSEEETKDE